MELEPASPPPRSPSLVSHGASVLRVLTRACVAIDRRLDGYRALAVVVVSAIGMVTGIGQFFTNALVGPHVAALVTLVVLNVVFTWAYVAALHAEVSQSGWGAALGESFAALKEYLSSTEEDDEPISPQERELRTRNEHRRLATLLTSLAIVTYPIASLLGLVVPSLDDTVGIVQGATIVVLAIGVWWWFRLRTPGRPLRPHSPSGPSDFTHLPPVLLLAPTRDNSNSLACIGGDPLLSALLHQLQRWRPGRRDHEKSYEQALIKFLRNRLPQASVRTQMYMTSHDDEAFRIDVVVDGRIGIEIKRNLRNHSELDRCLAQMQRYARTWRRRGPLFLLVCESERDFESSPQIARLVGAQTTDTPFKILIAGHRAR